MKLRDFFGQEKAIEKLCSDIQQERVSHAYLFSGPPGVGKTAIAARFAQALNCIYPERGDLCGRCISCQKYSSSNHPDHHFIEPTGTSIKIQQVREVKHQAQLKKYEGKYKTFIIDQAELMTAEAANSLLKILEEPPAYTVFILVSARPEGLPETILSRCKKISFSRISREVLVNYLMTEFNLPPEKISVLAEMAEGSLARARELAVGDTLALREKAWETLANFKKISHWQVLQLAEDLTENGEQAAVLLDFMVCWLRDLVIWQETTAEILLVNQDLPHRINKINISYSQAWRAISLINETCSQLRRKVNQRLALEVLFFKLKETLEKEG